MFICMLHRAHTNVCSNCVQKIELYYLTSWSFYCFCERLSFNAQFIHSFFSSFKLLSGVTLIVFRVQNICCFCAALLVIGFTTSPSASADFVSNVFARVVPQKPHFMLHHDAYYYYSFYWCLCIANKRIASLKCVQSFLLVFNLIYKSQW